LRRNDRPLSSRSWCFGCTLDQRGILLGLFLFLSSFLWWRFCRHHFWDFFWNDNTTYLNNILWAIHSNLKCTKKRWIFTLCCGSVNMKPCFPMTLMCCTHQQYFAHFIFNLLTVQKKTRLYWIWKWMWTIMESFWGQLGIWRWQIQVYWWCCGWSVKRIFATLKSQIDAGNSSNTILLFLDNFTTSFWLWN
jgi:hypothetical protein